MKGMFPVGCIAAAVYHAQTRHKLRIVGLGKRLTGRVSYLDKAGAPCADTKPGRNHDLCDSPGWWRWSSCCVSSPGISIMRSTRMSTRPKRPANSAWRSSALATALPPASVRARHRQERSRPATNPHPHATPESRPVPRPVDPPRPAADDGGSLTRRSARRLARPQRKHPASASSTLHPRSAGRRVAGAASADGACTAIQPFF